MIKKISTIFLSLMLVLCSVSFAGATETVTITPELQFNTLSVEVKTTIDDILTMKVYKLSYNSETQEYQIATPNVPAYIGEGYKCSVLNGLNVYEFESFNFSNTQDSGKYRIVINNTYTEDFNFVNKAHKVPFYRQLATATHDQIEGILQTAVNNNYVDFDLGGYFGYDDKIKTNINKALESLILPDLGVTPYEPTDEQVTSFETVLKPEIKRLLAAAELFTVSGAEFGDAVSEHSAELGLDLTFYNDTKYSLSPANVCSKLSGITPSSFSADDINKSFDIAVILSVIDTCDFGSVTEALDHYDGDCINLDRTKTTGFSDTQMGQVSSHMKTNKVGITDKSTIESAYIAGAEYVSGLGQQGGIPQNPENPGPSISPVAPSNPKPPQDSSDEEEVKPDNTVVEMPAELTDLDDAKWAKEAIGYLFGKEIVNGKGDGKYYPNDTVTREEFVKIIAIAFELPEGEENTEISDVSPDRWSYEFIMKAFNAEIITGDSETTFNPTGRMSRQDMAVMIYRLAKHLDYNFSGAGIIFEDNDEISDYAKEAVKVLGGEGIINGTGNDCYSPKETVTRAQAAKIIYELLCAMGEVK